MIQVLGIVCDNAANNDTLLEHMEELTVGPVCAETRVRCFAHVLNLVVKATLSVFACDFDDDGGPPTATQEADELEDAMNINEQASDDGNKADKEDTDKVDEDREQADKEDIEACADVTDRVDYTEADLRFGRGCVNKVCFITILFDWYETKENIDCAACEADFPFRCHARRHAAPL